TRPAWLVLKNQYHIREDGVYVTTSYKDGKWSWEASCEAETGGRPYEARHKVLEDGEFRPWSPEEPNLYTLRTELVVGGRVWDTVDTRFGFREARMTPDEGFFLNGERMKLNGACLHQEYAIFGAAAPPDLIRRQFLKLKEMGVNAVRTAHNPPPSAFMDLADELGMLVVSEFSDVWRRPKTTYDYARFFDEWHGRDVASWVRRDRNRPSIILWSLGNEVSDTHTDAEEGIRLINALKSAVRAHDPRGHAPVTLGSNYMAWENTQRCADHLDAVGYNYAERLDHPHHAEHPDWVIFGSETCSTVQSRGVYHFPLRQPLLADDDLQCSSLGNSTTSWGAKNIEDCIQDDKTAPFSLGQFVWSGQDYLGEPTPYHTKNSYFGMLDTAGFEKDAFHTFRAGWTDAGDRPLVHLYPHWDFSPGQMIDVRAASNLPEVELFLDGESLGRAAHVDGPTHTWQVPYRPGTLLAAAYQEDGSAAAQAERHSFGEAERLHLEYEHFDELTFVTVTARDAQGRTVENANRRVRVKALGGTLVGLDNGDAADMQPYGEDSRRMFSGRLLAVIWHKWGEKPRAEAAFDEADVPVRKIDLPADGLHVRARLLPENTTHADVQWRLTNAAGVDSNLG
ncbi:MAG TPA: glycoside hydrolase family 2 TIM barrel-domain containing protein, partial [Candidatus Limnocylindria bacterium]|nr:glycoside hydrolase family 2 TIM barrel-domain containing protein [Candidatus Limnocylindria bacterium]